MDDPMLPQEIQELIVGALYFDRPALATFSLVSKSWHWRARTLFFDNFTACMSVASREGERNTRQFVQLVQSPHSTLPRFIRSLKIEGPERTRIYLVVRDRRDLPKMYDILADSLSAIAHLLTCVRKLTLSSLSWSQLSPDAISSISSFSTVRDLRWDQVTVPNQAVGHHVFFSGVQSTRLENLSVIGVKTRDSINTFHPLPSQYYDAFSGLSSLEVDLGPSLGQLVVHPIFAALTEVACRLHTLHIHLFSEKQFDAVNRVLGHLGGRLKVLGLGGHHLQQVFRGFEVPSYVALPISVGGLNKLRELHIAGFEIDTHGTWKIMPVLAPYFLPLLDSIQSGDFAELIFHVYIDRDATEDICDIETFARALSKQFPTLARTFTAQRSAASIFRLSFESPTFFRWSMEQRRDTASRVACVFSDLYINGQLAVSMDGELMDLPEPPKCTVHEE